MQLQRGIHGRNAEEKLKTLTIHKESAYQGMKFLFVSFTQNGIPQNEVAAFEKDAETGLWTPAPFSTYGMTDESLRKAISDWMSKVGRN